MGKAIYFVVAFLESGLAIFGIRSPLEQPPYRIVETLDDAIEIRAYGPLKAVETEATLDEDAFTRLFRYITGANSGGTMIAMTAPVTQSGGPYGSTGQMNSSQAMTMRFYLPKSVGAAPPSPKDPRVRIVTIPARTIAVIRFSGRLSQENVATHREALHATLAKAGRASDGVAYFMGYDPPFTIPALRRNEIAVDLKP